MTSKPLTVLTRICLLLVLTLTLMGCGGSAAPPGVVPQPPPVDPTPGDYIWQLTGDADLFISTVNSNTGELGPPNLAGGPGWNSNGNIPGLAAIPPKKLLYSLDTSITVIRGFSMIGPGFHLAELTSLSASRGPLNNLTIDPSGKFLYIIESPATIEQFSIDSKTGTLGRGSSVTEIADLRQALVDPTGNFLYAIDLTAGRIFAYRIDGTTGSLATIPGSPFTVPAGGQPAHVVIENTGRFLYVSLFANGVAGFSIDGATGALTSIVGSPFSTSNQPSGIAVDPSGGLVYVCNFTDGSVDGFNINSASGILTAVPGSPFSTVAFPSSVVVDPSGQFLYVSNYPNSTVFGFRIDSSTGSLAVLTGSPFSAVAAPKLLMSLRIP
jgi:6-phosphogluconolactonase (cycloisomerase 2 family)